MRVILEAVSGPVAGRRIEVAPGTTLRIGRTIKSDYAIGQDTYLSGQHFAVECGGGQCRVRDLGSSNGTFLNGKRIVESPLQEGDSLSAGGSTFAVHIDTPVRMLRPEPAPVAAPTMKFPQATLGADRTEALELRAAPPWEGFSLAQSMLLDALFRDAEPVYAVLDPGRDTRIRVFLDAAGERYARLEEGDPASPHVALLPRDSRLLDVLIKEGWGRGWGFYFTARIGFEDAVYHWRNFFRLRSQNGQTVIFRFWDPCVLRAIVPAMGAEEAGQFFGLLSRLIVEGDQAGNAVEFSLGPRGARQQPLLLA